MLAELRQAHANSRLAQIKIFGRLRYAFGLVEFRNHGQQFQIDVGHARAAPPDCPSPKL